MHPVPPTSRHRSSASPLGPANRLTLRAEDCLTQRFARMACRRCADACPTRALSVTDDGPRLGTGCVDCGRCAVGCPTEALAVPGFAAPAAPATTGGPLAIDCWRVAPGDSPPGAWRVPCLGGLSAAALLERLAEAPDVGLVLLDRGFCDACPASGAATTGPHPSDAVLAEVGDLLQTIGLGPERGPRRLKRSLPIGRMTQDSGAPRMEARLSRRAFFTALAPAPEARPTATPATRTDTSRSRLLAALEHLAPPGATLPARLFPSLTTNADCADHRLCASACPTGALQGDQEAGMRGLRFSPDACLACGLCVQLCPERALSLSLPTGPAADRRPRWLTRHAVRICPECEADYSDDDPCCPACRRDRDFAAMAFRTLFGQGGRGA